jgi:hypothetical protein
MAQGYGQARILSILGMNALKAAGRRCKKKTGSEEPVTC